MTGAGVWVLLGLAAVALASPWAAVAVAGLLAVLWVAKSRSNVPSKTGADTAPENDE